MVTVTSSETGSKQRTPHDNYRITMESHKKIKRHSQDLKKKFKTKIVTSLFEVPFYESKLLNAAHKFCKINTG